MLRLFSVFLTLVFAANAAMAQQPSFASLKADRITYVSGYQVLRATGNVEIVFDTIILTASELVFDAQNNHIEATGPLRLQDGDNVTIVAEYASLSSDLKEAVLHSARMVLNRQLQISAVEIKRSEGRYTQLYKAAASSCVVTLANPTPLWQIRAKRIVHDEVEKQLYFENAQLRLGRVPIAYIPRLRVPDPSVKRANGFLVPGISTSDTRGTGITTPYFITLGDYADVTLTPTLYSTGTATLGYDFRKNFRNGTLNIEGAVSRDNQSANTNRAYVFANGNWKWRNGIKVDLQLQQTSDATYLSNHGLSHATRLENHLKLSRAKRTSYFGASVHGFRTLSSTTPPENIPYLLTDVSYRKRFAPGLFGGQAGLSLAVNGFQRRSAVDITGRDGVRISSSADWRRQWITAGGLVFGTNAELHADHYRIQQDSTYPAPITRITPILAADIRLPMARHSARATEVFEPRLQLVWSNSFGGAVPNDDSQFVEFDTANLFSFNRFAGEDVQETGLRANIGVTYARRTDQGWNVDAVLGKVVRLNNLGQFTAPSGLSGTASSYVLAAGVTMPSKFRVIQRMVLNSAASISRNETRFGYHGKRLKVDTSYLWLANGAAGNTANRSEWSVETGYQLSKSWHTNANWRYDLQNSLANDAELALTYRNDCIKVDFSLSRQFVSSSNVSASTNFAFQVTLMGFGARATPGADGKKCKAF